DAADWVNRSVLQLAELPEVRVLTRTTAVGCYDHGYLLAAEKRPGMQRLWHVRTRQVVLATGAHERPLVFANNDRPGIMLASAVRRYIHRYAVLPGSAVAVCTTSDSAYWTALDVQRSEERRVGTEGRRSRWSPLGEQRLAGGAKAELIW